MLRRIAVRAIRPAAVILLLSLFPVTGGTETRDMVKFEIAKRYYRQGVTYFNNMQYLAAVEFFRKAVKEYPDYHTARDHLARSYKLAGFVDAALKEWELLLELAPDNVSVTSKIENLRFLETVAEPAYSYSDLVIYDTYRSSKLKHYGFEKPVDIAVDNEKSLYITSFSTGSLVKINANGEGVFSYKMSLSSKLYGIDYHNGRIAVSDFKNDLLYLVDKKGRVLKKIGGSGSGNGLFHGPEGVCFSETGNIFVVDSGNNRLQKLDDEGNFIQAFGKKGEYEGELSNPTDVALQKDRVYVTDNGNKRIVVFDDSGNFIENLEVQGLESPRGITAQGDTLIVVDEKKGVLYYTVSSGETSWFNYKDEGGFSRIMSSTVDRDGYLYCLDYDKESVFVFSPVQKRYSNLSLEITSVDTNKFPVVAFYVNIRSRDGSPIYGLTRDNFTITEDSAPISGIYIDYLKRLRPSVSIVLCVDRSRENSGYHNDIPWISDFIMKKMRKNDSIKVLNFHRDSWEGNRFDWSRRRTIRALQKREYGSGKNFGNVLYNAISDSIPRLNRRGVVVITDGTVQDDSFQNYTPREIVHYARAHYIPIYIVSFKKPDRVLAEIARETGGGVFRPGELDGLRALYDNIKKSEEYRYVLVYSTFKLPSFKGWWSDVKIEVDQKGQKGVEWGGYFVP